LINKPKVMSLTVYTRKCFCRIVKLPFFLLTACLKLTKTR